jgi:hypothetical protein
MWYLSLCYIDMFIAIGLDLQLNAINIDKI